MIETAPRENLSFLSAYSSRDIGSWLIHGFHSNSFTGIQISDKQDFWESELSDLFQHSSAADKTLFSEGITYALDHWDFRPSYNKALSSMADFVLRIRIPEGALEFIRMIDANSIYGEKAEHAKESVVLTLTQYDPSPRVKEALERWFYDDSFDPRYAGLLLNGLVNNAPEDFERNVDRFIQREQTIPGYFDLRVIVAMFHNYKIDLLHVEKIFGGIVHPVTKARYVAALQDYRTVLRKFDEHHNSHL